MEGITYVAVKYMTRIAQIKGQDTNRIAQLQGA